MCAGVRVTTWFAPPDKQPENGNLTFRSVATNRSKLQLMVAMYEAMHIRW